VAVPPLHHRILDAGEDRIAPGVRKGGRERQVVDDVQGRHDQNEGQVVPVGDVDVRFLAAGERTQIENQIGDPDDDQPDVGVPFWLGIFLRLRDAHEVTADGEHAEEIVADEHEPGTELVRQARAPRPLHDVERGGDQRIATEAKDDAGGVHRPQPSEACPGGVEGHLGVSQQPRHPIPDEHRENGPRHRQDNAGLHGIIVILREPLFGRLWRVVAGDDHEGHRDAETKHDESVSTQWIRLPRSGHQQPDERHEHGDDERKEPLGLG